MSNNQSTTVKFALLFGQRHTTKACIKTISSCVAVFCSFALLPMAGLCQTQPTDTLVDRIPISDTLKEVTAELELNGIPTKVPIKYYIAPSDASFFLLPPFVISKFTIMANQRPVSLAGIKRNDKVAFSIDVTDLLKLTRNGMEQRIQAIAFQTSPSIQAKDIREIGVASMWNARLIFKDENNQMMVLGEDTLDHNLSSATKPLRFSLSKEASAKLVGGDIRLLSLELMGSYQAKIQKEDFSLHASVIHQSIARLQNNLHSLAGDVVPDYLVSLSGSATQQKRLEERMSQQLAVDISHDVGVRKEEYEGLLQTLLASTFKTGVDFGKMANEKIVTFLINDNLSITAPIGELRTFASKINERDGSRDMRVQDAMHNHSSSLNLTGNMKVSIGPLSAGGGLGSDSHKSDIDQTHELIDTLRDHAQDIERTATGQTRTFSSLHFDTANSIEGQNEWEATIRGTSEYGKTDVPVTVKLPLSEVAYPIADDISYVPIGTIVAYAGNKAPEGWLICDGTPIPEGYTILKQVLAAGEWQKGVSAGTVNLPDLKNRFLRGAGDGRPVGFKEEDALQNHKHEDIGHTHPRSMLDHLDGVSGDHAPLLSVGLLSRMNMADRNSPLNNFGTDYSKGFANLGGVTALNGVNVRTDSETRPKNTAVYFIIKAGPKESVSHAVAR